MDNVLFSRTAMRALLALDKDEQMRVHEWIENLSQALKTEATANDDPTADVEYPPADTQVDISPYGGPFVGVTLKDGAHLVCAFKDNTCAVLSLNAAGDFEFQERHVP